MAKTINVKVYQPHKVERDETQSTAEETHREYNLRSRKSLDEQRFDSNTHRNVLPRTLEVPFSYSDTLSSILDRCFEIFGLVS